MTAAPQNILGKRTIQGPNPSKTRRLQSTLEDQTEPLCPRLWNAFIHTTLGWSITSTFWWIRNSVREKRTWAAGNPSLYREKESGWVKTGAGLKKSRTGPGKDRRGLQKVYLAWPTKEDRSSRQCGGVSLLMRNSTAVLFNHIPKLYTVLVFSLKLFVAWCCFFWSSQDSSNAQMQAKWNHVR